MKALALMLFMAGLARAAAPPPRDAGDDKARTTPGKAAAGAQACRDDIERWCRGVKPGEGRLGACLEKHAKALSPQCRRWAEHDGPDHRTEAFRELEQPSAAPAPRR